MSVSDSPEKSDALPPMDAFAAEQLSRKTCRSGNFWLQDEVASRMAHRLPLIRQKPRRWLDWHPRTGGLAALSLVQERYPDTDAIAIQAHSQDLHWLKKVKQKNWWQLWKKSYISYSTEVECNADMVWSNMLLHQHADPLQLMKAWSQALNPQGFVMFSCLGPDTLQELRALYQHLQWPPPHHTYTDMHDWGDMLLQAGFAQPVMDMERITLTFANAVDALKDLRGWGRNLNPGRFAAMRGRHWRDQLCAEMNRQLPADGHDGRLVLSFEIIYGHAFKAPPSIKPNAEQVVSLQEMKKMLALTSLGLTKP